MHTILSNSASLMYCSPQIMTLELPHHDLFSCDLNWSDLINVCHLRLSPRAYSLQNNNPARHLLERKQSYVWSTVSINDISMMNSCCVKYNAVFAGLFIEGRGQASVMSKQPRKKFRLLRNSNPPFTYSILETNTPNTNSIASSLGGFYSPVWKTVYYTVVMSVCPSLPPSEFSDFFIFYLNMLWDINFKVGIWIQ